MTLRRSAILFAAFVLMGFGAFMSGQAEASDRYWEEPPRRYRDAGRALDAGGGIRWHQSNDLWMCGTNADIGGCAVMWPDGECDVYLVPDAFNDRDARDHEGAHCAGWRH